MMTHTHTHTPVSYTHLKERKREREEGELNFPIHGKAQTFQCPCSVTGISINRSVHFCIMAKSYVALSLNEKVKVIEAKEKDKLSVREIMMQFKCGKTQIYNMLKQKDKIMNEWLQGNGRMKRKAKITGNEEINEVV